MHIIAKIPYEDEELTLEVNRVYIGSVNNYRLTDKRFKFFQFDCWDRPTDYMPEHRENKWFKGYLIGVTKRGKREIVECSIKVKN